MDQCKCTRWNKKAYVKVVNGTFSLFLNGMCVEQHKFNWSEGA